MKNVFESKKIILNNLAVIPFVEKELKNYFVSQGSTFDVKRMMVS